MYKVIVERPRRSKHDEAEAARRRNDSDGPKQLGMRAGYGRPRLNENLSPLRRFLRAQVGRPWDKVYGEISAGVDRRNTVQQHIHQHIDDFIATAVEVRDGRIVDLRRRYGVLPNDCGIWQELYVDPRTGLIRCSKVYRSCRKKSADRQAAARATVEARRRILDERTQLHLLAGEWFEVQVLPLPEVRFLEVAVNGRMVRRPVADMKFDVVLKRSASRMQHGDDAARLALYGSTTLYASAKRQLSRREKTLHRLR